MNTEIHDNQWDPLSPDIRIAEEIVGATLKRMIKNIIKSYTGYFDFISELLQNSLDAVDKRKDLGEEGYEPKIWIEINIQENYVSVTDNGIGFLEDEFRTFLRPNVSFKKQTDRGNKGVGATYLAYGFNYLHIGTKTPDFDYIGVLENGRLWVEDNEGIISRPIVKPSPIHHEIFNEIDKGSTFCLKLIGNNIRPQDLGWLSANNADQWEVILRLKTPLGGIYIDTELPKTKCYLKVISRNGQISEKEISECTYLYPHIVIPASANLKEMIETQQELARRGRPTVLPSNYNNLVGIYAYYNNDDILSDSAILQPRLTDLERSLLEQYNLKMYGYMTYSTDILDEYNNDIVRIRRGERILKGGLQLATNNMPQGEQILIPLTANIGYQNTSHVIIHFDYADPDLGRKGFQPELKTLGEKLSVTIVNKFMEWRANLRRSTGSRRQLSRDRQIHDWKTETEAHEQDNPIIITRRDVFLPLREISLTSTPIVEQDVVSLFNQLLAGGVIRGIKMMSASQYKTYDGLWRAITREPLANYIYDHNTNPLGILDVDVEEFISSPYVLEYKYAFKALLEDFEKGDKDESSVDLLICWEIDDSWKKRYTVTPLLLNENLHHREIHGITHIFHHTQSNDKVFWGICLKELIEYINDPDSVQEYQKNTYIENIF